MRLALSVLVVCLVYVADAYQGFGYHYVNPANQRLFWPVTVTSTLTISTTCTQLAANACPLVGRRRRGIVLEEDNEEQFLSATPVQLVEPTQVLREARSADPQYLVASPYGYQGQNIESGIYNSPYHYGPAVMSYYGSGADQRLFFGLLQRTTLFLTSTFTVTSSPTCNSAGLLPQCGSG